MKRKEVSLSKKECEKRDQSEHCSESVGITATKTPIESSIQDVGEDLAGAPLFRGICGVFLCLDERSLRKS
jgi:hypothetical protein